MYIRDGIEYENYGAYLRSKNLHIGYCATARGWDATKQKRWDAELQAYRDAVRQGVQPAGTDMKSIETAMRISDQTQKPYRAGEIPTEE